MASKKPGAPKGATNASVAAPAAAPVASAVEVTVEKATEAAQAVTASAEAVDAAQSDATAETAVNASGEDQADKGAEVVADEVSASTEALQALGFGGPHDGKSAAPISDWPRTYRATNNTRMHLCIPVHGLTVERFGAHTDIVISSEDALAGLKADMDAIAFLNSFDDKAFLLEHVAGE